MEENEDKLTLTDIKYNLRAANNELALNRAKGHIRNTNFEVWLTKNNITDGFGELLPATTPLLKEVHRWYEKEYC